MGPCSVRRGCHGQRGNAMGAGQYKVSRTIRHVGWMRRVTLFSVMGVALCVVSHTAFAQQAAPQQPAPAQAAPAAGAPAQAAPRPRPNIGSAADRAANQRGPVINDSFSIRQDEDLYQLEEAT